MFTGTAALVEEYSMSDETPRAPRAKMGRASRWDHDGVDLKNALSSVAAAGTRLLDARRYAVAGDTTSSRAELEYSLDQAALARSMLDDFLFRHGRDPVRPHVDDDETDVRRRKREETKARERIASRKRSQTRYQKLVAQKLCPQCGKPAAPGRVLCEGHLKARADADAARKQREREQLEAVSRVRKIGDPR